MATLTRRGRNAVTAARLPALTPQTQVSDAALRQFLESVREWLEVRLGARGDFFERAVTHRELQEQLNALNTASSTETDLSGVNGEVQRLQTLLGLVTAQVQSLQNQVLVSTSSTAIQNIYNQVRDVAVEDVTVFAQAMRPSVTAGCSALTTIEFASTQPNFQALLFDPTTDESADFSAMLPSAWAGKQFRILVYWGHGSGGSSFATKWEIQANSTSDQETVILDFVTGSYVEDTGGTAGVLYIGAMTGTVPIASNKNADGDLVSLRITRRNSGVTGNLNIDAALLAVRFVLADVAFVPDVETEAYWDAATQGGGWTLSEDNMRALCTYGVAVSNIKAVGGRTTGKRYFEVALNNITAFGTGVRHDIGVTTTSGSMPTGGSYANTASGGETGAAYRIGGAIYANNSNVGSVSALADGDVVGVAVDLDTGDIWFARNGTWTQGDPATGTSPEGTIASTASTYYPAICAESGADLDANLRTVESQFSYSIPSGFVSWGNDL